MFMWTNWLCEVRAFLAGSDLLPSDVAMSGVERNHLDRFRSSLIPSDGYVFCSVADKQSSKMHVDINRRDAPAFEFPLLVGRPNIGDKATILRYVEEILDRQWLSNNGVVVREFEAEIAE